MKKFWKDEGGAVATEYAVITTIIALGIVVGTTLFATGLNNWFSDAGSELDTVTIPDVP
ncbi:MAG: Flp family type IVb pilin [bacterium]